MNVTNEVQQKFQGKEPLRLRRCGVFQLGPELLDLVHNAIVRWPLRRAFARGDRGMSKASLVLVGGVDFDIDEVPILGRVVTARCARLPSSPGLAGAAKDRSRCIRPVTHFYSGKPMHFYSGLDTRSRRQLRTVHQLLSTVQRSLLGRRRGD